MCKLENHKVNGANETLEILAEDAAGAGGANHRYVISGFNTATNPSKLQDVPHDDLGKPESRVVILFQNGPIKESGVNGVTQEALLAICEHRLFCFQAGPYACADNAEALDHIQQAMECLQRRTKARIARGVEGTHTK